MLKELEIGEELGLSKRELKNTLDSLIKSLGIQLNSKMKLDWQVLLRDKKISDDSIILPLVINEGVSKLVVVKISKLKELI